MTEERRQQLDSMTQEELLASAMARFARIRGYVKTARADASKLRAMVAPQPPVIRITAPTR